MKKIILSGLVMFGIFWLIMTGCAKQSEDVLARQSGAAVCDTTNVKYAMDIVPILQNSCYECHGSGSSSGSGGIVLQGYSSIAVWAANGYLAGCVAHKPGYVAMPYLLPKLSDCEVNMILAWVNQGALNN